MFDLILNLLQQMLITHGPMSAGWILSVLLGWVLYKVKIQYKKEKERIQERLLKTKDEYIEKIQEMNDKLNQLNVKHSEIVNHISEKRVEDLKELTEDYNQLATNTLVALDRFVVALEVSNSKKSRG